MSLDGDEEADAEILVGTYEDYVVGYRVERISGPQKKRAKTSNDAQPNGTSRSRDQQRPDGSPEYQLEQSFATRCHSGSVKCLVANRSGTLAASAGFDEMLNLFSLNRRKLLQTIEAPISCAAFVEDKHLVCGAMDGNIYIYEAAKGSMSLVKTLKGHKDAVESISVHPSAKLMLSIAKDNTMRTWNLIKGRCAYVTNIKALAHLVCWCPKGEHFALAANKEVYLYNNSGILEHCLKLDKRVNSIEFMGDQTFALATDSGDLEFFDLKRGASVMKHSAHESRVKRVKFLADSGTSIKYCTISSDGQIRLWSVSSEFTEKPKQLAHVDTGARLTTMTSANCTGL